jgi:hypothetical protein
MRSHAAGLIRSAGLFLLLVVAAACTSGAPSTTSIPPEPTGGPPTSSPVVTPAVTASPSAVTASPPVVTASPPATPDPATPDAAAEPPAARLAGLDRDAVAGDLGTFAWDGLVSDAPWIVGAARGTAAHDAALSVSFQPGGQVTGWRARWAPVTAGEAGQPADGGSGTTGGVIVAAPHAPGAWSLQLTVDFGAGRTASWYWRVKVTR